MAAPGDSRRGELPVPLGLTGREERGECLGSPGRAGQGTGCPQGLQPLWAQQVACGQGTWDLPLLLPSPPACLPQADPDQTLEGRELRRGSSQGPVPRIQHHWAGKRRGRPGWRAGKMQSDPLIGPVSLPTSCVLGPQPAARSPDNSVPSRPTRALGPSRGDGGRLWGAWESRWCFKREISGGLEVSEQGGGKRRAVM